MGNQKTRTLSSADSSERTRREWFILGCVILTVGVAFVAWTFAIGEITSGRRFVLLWILPIASAFACSCFRGSLKVSGPVQGFIISASSGFAVWGFTFLSLTRIPTTEPVVPQLVDTPAFEVLENSTSFDLSGWKSVRESERTSKVFKSITSTTLLMHRLRKEIDTFPHRVAYSTFIEPEIDCPTHSAVLKSVPGEFTESTTPWDINFDVSKEPLFDDFSLRYKISVWNAFQGTTSEWSAVTVAQATRSLKIIIHFPKFKPFKSYALYSYLRREKAKKELFLEASEVVGSADKTELTWLVPNPHVGYIYRIEWGW